jgi:polyvinyl alcohol dehydrogenase (cytochrome)
MSKQKLLLLVPLLGLFALVTPVLAEEFAEIKPLGATTVPPAALPPPGTKFNVLGRPSGKPDASVIFGERCAECHARGLFSPTLEQMSNLTTEEAHKELTWGVMMEFANGLDDFERWELAKYVTSLKTDEERDTRGHGMTMCKNTMPLVANPTHDWPGLSKDNRSSRVATNSQISSETVKNLKLKWAVGFPQVHSFVGGGQPVSVVGDRVFIGSLNHWVYSFDTSSGCAHWAFEAEFRIRSNVAVSDGVIVFGDTGANAYALNADTGKLMWRHKVDYTPTARVNGKVMLHDGVAYIPVTNYQEVLNMGGRTLEFPCCTARGAVAAYDLHTGERKWKTFTIDERSQFIGLTPNGVNRYGPSGVTVFSGMSVDEKRGVIYVPTANQQTEPVIEESDAIIALDMETGVKVWVKGLAPEHMGGQDVYHLGCEAWVDAERKTCSPLNPTGQGDRDIVAPAILVERQDGKEVLLVGTKDGTLYALDPDAKGKIIWQTRVGRGGEVGGIEWGFASDQKNAYVPVLDMDADMQGSGSLTAVDLMTGKFVWRVEDVEAECEGKPVPLCGNAFGLPTTVSNDIVFSGTSDGVLRAYNKNTGDQVWSYNTAHDYNTVNDIKGYGGGLSYGGPVIVDNQLFVFSGNDYAQFTMPGNVLLMFELDK